MYNAKLMKNSEFLRSIFTNLGLVKISYIKILYLQQKGDQVFKEEFIEFGEVIAMIIIKS